MQTALVLVVNGPDRPGIVERVSSAVAAHEGSWVEARMARLAGRFAGVVSITIPASNIPGLRRVLEGLQSEGLTVLIEEADANDPGPGKGKAVVLELTGSDREGIVKEVSAVLAKRGVNMEEMVTRRREAPMAGGMLFELQAQLRVPLDLPLASLREALEALSSELAVDITLGELEGSDG